MSDTLDKEYLLEVLDGAEARSKKHPRVRAYILGMIIDIERGIFDTKEPAE